MLFLLKNKLCFLLHHNMLLLSLLLVSLQACEVGFAVDVVLQELSSGCPTSRNPFE